MSQQGIRMKKFIGMGLAIWMALYGWRLCQDERGSVPSGPRLKSSVASDLRSGEGSTGGMGLQVEPALGSIGVGVAPAEEVGEQDVGLARGMLEGITAMTALSDAILDHAGQPWSHPLGVLSGPVGLDDLMGNPLAGYPMGSETLADIYARTAGNPGLYRIREALGECGIGFDPASDCLLDCYRMVVGLGESIGFLQDMRAKLSEAFRAEDVAQELRDLQEEEVGVSRAFYHYFRERFLGRHGLTDVQTEALLGVLGDLPAPTATASDLYVPLNLPP